MAEPDQNSRGPARRRGLESVVKLFLSRSRPTPAQSSPSDEQADARLRDTQEVRDLLESVSLETASAAPAPSMERDPVRRLGTEQGSGIEIWTEAGGGVAGPTAAPREGLAGGFTVPLDALAGGDLARGGSLAAPEGREALTGTRDGSGSPVQPYAARGELEDWADELPPHDPYDETLEPGEEVLPPLRLGEEAARARTAFQLEEHLVEAAPLGTEIEFEFTEDGQPEPRGALAPEASAEQAPERAAGFALEPLARATPEALTRPTLEPFAGFTPEPSVGLQLPLARVALVLAAVPYRLRRLLLDALAQPLSSCGRRVMLLETEPRLDDTTDVYESALELDLPVFRRNLGVTPSEMLLLGSAARAALLDKLAADERRAELVLIDLELPESILCPRLQFLVDTLVVAVTVRESSLYEAYRALRGLPERRPELAPFVVPVARSAEEAQQLLDRFRSIAKDFLNVRIMDGGWIGLPAAGSEEAGFSVANGWGACLSASLTEALMKAPGTSASASGLTRDRERSFFDHLGDWFGSLTAS